MSYFTLYYLPNSPDSVTYDISGLDGTESQQIMAFDSSGAFLGACDATTEFGFGPVDPCSVMLSGSPCCGDSTYSLTINAPKISYVALGWDDVMNDLTNGLDIGHVRVLHVPTRAPEVPEPRDTFALFALGLVLIWGAWMWRIKR